MDPSSPGVRRLYWFLRQRLRLTLSTKTAIPASMAASLRSSSSSSSLFNVYAASCFTYALLGAYALARGFASSTQPGGCPPLFPGIRVEVALLFLQSVCSFGCDAYSFGRASVWKPLDRTMASLFVLFQATKLAWLEMAAEEMLCWTLTLSVGVLCFMRSMSCLKTTRGGAGGAAAGSGGGVGGSDAAMRRTTRSMATRSQATGGKDSKGGEEAEEERIEERPEEPPLISAFLRWHSIWHISLPLGAAVWMEIRARRMRAGVAC